MSIFDVSITQLQDMSTDDLLRYSQVLSTQMGVSTIVKTNPELLAMSSYDLQAYSTTLTDTIAYETKVIEQTMRQQTILATRISQSQSTSYSYRRQILNNNNRLIAYRFNYNQVVNDNSTVFGHIDEYNTLIQTDMDKIRAFKNLIGGLEIEASSISTTLGGTSFNTKARQYSTLYMKYMLADSIYQNCLTSTAKISSLYDSNVIAEKQALFNLNSTANVVLSTTTRLTDLYKDKVRIHSNLTKNRIDEILYTSAYNSTVMGLTAISSLYEVAALFSTYNNLVKAEDENMKSYNTAYNYYTALGATNNTISGATAAGWRSLMDIYSGRESTIELQMSNTSNAITGMLDSNSITWLGVAAAAVDINTATENSLRSYLTLAQQSFADYSTSNDDANTRFTSRTTAYQRNYSNYISNVNASNYMMSNISVSNLDVERLIQEIEMIPSIREKLVRKYEDSIKFSTVMTSTFINETSSYTYYSTLYDSTSKSIKLLNELLTDNKTSTYNIIAKLNTLSTIIDTNTMNIAGYTIEGEINYTLEDLAAMQYRQTYAISKRIHATQIYEGCVVTQIQKSPMAPNLDVQPIATAYNNLNTVNTFLNTFATIYRDYDNHMVNLYNVSTLIGNQIETHSTLTTYRQISYLNPSDSRMADDVITTATALEGLGSLVEVSSLKLATSQRILTNDKLTFMQNYVNTFPVDEVQDTETSISTFLKAGF